jgi:hypothetical protein
MPPTLRGAPPAVQNGAVACGAWAKQRRFMKRHPHGMAGPGEWPNSAHTPCTGCAHNRLPCPTRQPQPPACMP